MYKPPAATNGNNVARAICWWWDAWLPSSTMMSKAVATERARSSPRVAGYSDLGLILCRFWIEAERGLVFVIELFSHRGHLPTFELGDFDSTPTLGSADERAEHQLQNSSLTKGVGNDLEAAALLDEQAFKQIHRADRPAMGHRELKVCDTGLEVVHETCDAAFLLPVDHACRPV